MFNTIFSSHLQKALYALMPQASADTPPFARSLVYSNFPPQNLSSVNSLLTSASSTSTRPCIKWYLSSIRYFQIMQSYPDPFVKDMPRLQYVLRGIKYDEAKKNQQSRQRLPVTIDILQKVYQVLLHNPTDFDNVVVGISFVFSSIRRNYYT